MKRKLGIESGCYLLAVSWLLARLVGYLSRFLADPSFASVLPERHYSPAVCTTDSDGREWW